MQEPELEGSWYSEKGPHPEFSPSQENGTVIHVQLGYDVCILQYTVAIIFRKYCQKADKIGRLEKVTEGLGKWQKVRKVTEGLGK